MKIFITGGTTGIGLALAKLYLVSGGEVGICGRDLAKIPIELKDRYGERLKTYKVDVVNREELYQAIHHFAQGDLDLLIANAGISIGNKSKKLDYRLAREVINTNLLGLVNSFEAATEIMMKKGSGQLVSIASVAGFVGLPGAAPYSASKAAVIKFSESLSIDLAKFGIHVTTIAPGFIDTPLTQKNNHPMPFIMGADKAAVKIKKAIDEKKALYVFPWPMKILVYLLEKMPRTLYRFLMGRFSYLPK